MNQDKISKTRESLWLTFVVTALVAATLSVNRVEASWELIKSLGIKPSIGTPRHEVLWILNFVGIALGLLGRKCGLSVRFRLSVGLVILVLANLPGNNAFASASLGGTPVGPSASTLLSWMLVPIAIGWGCVVQALLELISVRARQSRLIGTGLFCCFYAGLIALPLLANWEMKLMMTGKHPNPALLTSMHWFVGVLAIVAILASRLPEEGELRPDALAPRHEVGLGALLAGLCLISTAIATAVFNIFTDSERHKISSNEFASEFARFWDNNKWIVVTALAIGLVMRLTTKIGDRQTLMYSLFGMALCSAALMTQQMYALWNAGLEVTLAMCLLTICSTLTRGSRYWPLGGSFAVIWIIHDVFQFMERDWVYKVVPYRGDEGPMKVVLLVCSVLLVAVGMALHRRPDYEQLPVEPVSE